MYYFTSSNKITNKTLDFFDINSTSIQPCKVILMMKQHQILCCQVKLKSLFAFFLFSKEKIVFLCLGIGVFDRSCSEGYGFSIDQIIVHFILCIHFIQSSLILLSDMIPGVNLTSGKVSIGGISGAGGVWVALYASH